MSAHFRIASLLIILSLCFTACNNDEPERSSAKELIEFAFLKVNNPSLDQDYATTISGTTITADLPATATLASLKATFRVSDKAVVKVGTVAQTSGQSINDFTQARVYTVIAEDNTTKDFEVIVNRAPSAQKAITEFKFLRSLNSHLDNDYSGVVSGTSITVGVPHGFKVNKLVASFVASGNSTVAIGSAAQISGESKNDFTGTVTYRVTAEDGSTADYSVSLERTGIAPNASANSNTSIHLWNTNYLHTDLSEFIESRHGGYWGDEFSAQAFYDFDKDGDKDLIAATINFDSNEAIDIHFYRNNAGTFTKDQSVFGAHVPQFVHARQIVLGDFDNNGWMDVVFAAHGYDKDPFPGEQQKILLNANGSFTAHNIPLPMPAGGNFTFNHSVCAGDIDNDGDLDLFFTNNMRLATSGLFMINNGDGTFTYNASVFPESIQHKPAFTSSLYDIDNDGYLDLVLAGHDKDTNLSAEQGLKPTILWGNYTGKYSTARMTTLPVVDNYGVSNSVSFLDYNKDGNTDIIFGKTGDGSGTLPFYQGYYVQLLTSEGNRSFSDASASIQNNATTSGGWVVWFLPHDVDSDGDTDITTADKWYNLQWRNEGGTFTKY